jgi:Protein of unknown function (DUF3237)
MTNTHGLAVAAPVETRHLYDVRAVADAPRFTASPLGIRSTNLIREGSVRGERVNGRLLPAGGDWMLVDGHGTGHIDARYLIETQDGGIIQVFYSGRLVFHGDSLGRLRAGQSLTEADTYFRAAPTFTAPASYDWLNKVQAIAIGRLEAGADRTTIVHYRVLELL